MLTSTDYRLHTLTFGDIYGQILIWMLVIVSLAAGLALMGTSKPTVALVGVGLILVLSLPFLLFAFTTTLLNHITLNPLRLRGELPRLCPAKASWCSDFQGMGGSKANLIAPEAALPDVPVRPPSATLCSVRH